MILKLFLLFRADECFSLLLICFLMNSFTVHVKKLLQKNPPKQLQWVEAFLLLIGYQPQPYYLKRLVSKKVNFLLYTSLPFLCYLNARTKPHWERICLSSCLLFIMGSSVYLGTNYLVHWFNALEVVTALFFSVQLLLEWSLSPFPERAPGPWGTQAALSVPDRPPTQAVPHLTMSQDVMSDPQN